MSQRVLALAGLFQASELVRQAATHGTWSGFAASASLDSLFALDAESPAAVYGGKDRIRLGLETLLSVLSGEQQHAATLTHVVGLLQLERKFRRNQDMQARVGEELERIEHAYPELERHEREDRQAGDIARLYCETVSSLTPRIVVQGSPRHLQNERTVNWIRTLLFSGLRSAVLWAQLGGGRFSLLFGRKRMLEDACRILEG